MVIWYYGNLTEHPKFNIVLEEDGTELPPRPPSWEMWDLSPMRWAS